MRVEVDNLSTPAATDNDILFFYRLVSSPDMFHSLRKLADVIEIILNLNVIRVDIPAHILFWLIVRIRNLNQSAVGNREQVVIFGINEADTLLRTLQMAV